MYSLIYKPTTSTGTGTTGSEDAGLVGQPSPILTANLKAVAQRCFSDAEFRQGLHHDLEATLLAANFTLTTQELSTLKTYIATIATHTAQQGQGLGVVPTNVAAEWIMGLPAAL